MQSDDGRDGIRRQTPMIWELGKPQGTWSLRTCFLIGSFIALSDWPVPIDFSMGRWNFVLIGTFKLKQFSDWFVQIAFRINHLNNMRIWRSVYWRKDLDTYLNGSLKLPEKRWFSNGKLDYVGRDLETWSCGTRRPGHLETMQFGDLSGIFVSVLRLNLGLNMRVDLLDLYLWLVFGTRWRL